MGAAVWPQGRPESGDGGGHRGLRHWWSGGWCDGEVRDPGRLAGQAYRFALDPTPSQVAALESHCGGARFAYNHLLAHVKSVMDQRDAERSYGVAETELTPALGWSLAALRKCWNSRKHVVAPWWGENSKEAYSSGLDALARGLDAWSRSRRGERAGAPVGFPRFKSKHRAGKSVRFTTGTIRVEADRHHITLPRLGRIKAHESTRKLARRIDAGTARILSATVTLVRGRWMCSFQVLVQRAVGTPPAHARRSTHPVVGVDVGVKDLLVVAAPDGTEIARVPAPKSLAKAQSRLRALQRRTARQVGPTITPPEPGGHRRIGGGAPRPVSVGCTPTQRRYAMRCCTRRRRRSHSSIGWSRSRHWVLRGCGRRAGPVRGASTGPWPMPRSPRSGGWLQDDVVRVGACRGRPVLPVEQAVFGVWRAKAKPDPRRPHVRV